MTYNTLYERFVDQGQNEVQGYIAYGLYKNAKRQWVTQFKADNNRDPTQQELATYVSGFTAQTVQTYETQAASILAAFADGAIEDAKPAIVETALRGSFLGSIGQSITANVIYTVLLLALVLVLAYAGVDILGIVEKVRRGS